EAPVIVFGDPESPNTAALRTQGVEIVSSKGRDLCGVLRELGSRSLQSVLVEGGSTIAGEFLDAGLVNKITFFIAPKIVGGAEAPGAVGGSGVEAMSEALELERVTVIPRGRDIEVTGYPRNSKGTPADEG
ncbi:MAG TPA: dihydrofolate reductase family protein, partial [Pyrinomonadaceae bacterium]|nr:dihydrofolate reductase family protein [Pyrinomonadaceae bacterium]